MSPNTKRFAALAASVSLAVLAGACTTVGPNFAQPEAPKASGYAAPGEATPAEARLDATASAGPWWTAFGSPVLDATIRQALADSPTLAEADATLRQSQSALAQARGAAGPQVDATAGVNRERANLQAFGFTSFGDVTLEQPDLQPLFGGRRVGYDLDLFGGESGGSRARRPASRPRPGAATRPI
jgi:outer membrane protein TolC